MAISKLTTDLQHIQALNDRPNANSGMTASEVKAAFDQAGTDIKTYINSILTVEVDASLATGTSALTTHKSSGDHDGRYYTETEINAQVALLETKADLTTNRKLSASGDFTGTLNGQVITATDPGLSSAFAAFQVGYAKEVAKVYNVKGYGANGDGDETSEIQDTIDAAFAANSKFVFFPSGAYSATALTHLDDVNLVGDSATLTVGGIPKTIQNNGSYSGSTASIYSKALEEMNNKVYNGLDRAKVAIQEKALRVAYIGDSITEGFDQTSPEDSYTSLFSNQLVKTLPDVTVTSGNFALASRNSAQAQDSTYLGLASEPGDTSLGFYRAAPWGDGTGSTVGRSWEDHIKSFKPDLFLIAFGMNDAGGTSSDAAIQTQLQTLITYSRTWPNPPSIVLVTSIMSTKNMAHTSERQDILNAVNRSIREFGKNNGYVVADANRLYEILLDGKDVGSLVHNQEKNWVNYATTQWTGDKSNYSLVGTTLTPTGGTGKYIRRTRTFYNGFVQFNVTPAALGASGWIILNYRIVSDLSYLTLIVQPGNGNGSITLYYGGNNVFATVGSLTILTATAYKIRLEASGAIHKVYLNDVLVLTGTTYQEMHEGEIEMGGSATLPTFANLILGYADPVTGASMYTENDLLGVYNDSNASGNGINHPSGLGHSMVYYPSLLGVVRSLTQPIRKSYQQLSVNNNFDKWERGTTFTNPASATFTADHWKVFNATSGTFPTVIHSQQILTSGDIPGSYYFYRINVDGAGTSLDVSALYDIRNNIENGTRLYSGAGKKITKSYWLRSSIANKRVGVCGIQNYGTGGSPSAQEIIQGSIITLTSTWTKYTFTFNTNTLVGKTFGTNNDDFFTISLLEVWGTTTATSRFGGGTAESFVGAGNIDIAQVQENEGDVALAFQPRKPAEITAENQRFVVVYKDANTTFPIGNGFAVSTTVARIQVELPETMRIAPTLTATATDWQLSDGVTATDLTAISIVSGQSSNKTVTLLCTVASGLTQFRPYQLIADGTANRLMIFDAEI